MAEKLELKKLSKEHVGAALERAEHYRLLNVPEQAESICLDVLEVEPDNQKTIALLILAMTDQFGTKTAAPAADVRALLPRLTGEYQRVYYEGLIFEREALAWLDRGPSRMFAYDGYRSAMECYERADALSERNVHDPILRWNSCLRTIRKKRLKPHGDDGGEFGLE